MHSDGTGAVTKYKSFIHRNDGNVHEVTKVRNKLIQDSVCNRNLETQQLKQLLLSLKVNIGVFYIITEDYNNNIWKIIKIVMVLIRII